MFPEGNKVLGHPIRSLRRVTSGDRSTSAPSHLAMARPSWGAAGSWAVASKAVCQAGWSLPSSGPGTRASCSALPHPAACLPCHPRPECRQDEAASCPPSSGGNKVTTQQGPRQGWGQGSGRLSAKTQGRQPAGAVLALDGHGTPRALRLAPSHSSSPQLWLRGLPGQNWTERELFQSPAGVGV